MRFVCKPFGVLAREYGSSGVSLRLLIRQGSMNCPHKPSCPSADALDCEVGHVVAVHPEQVWSLLCYMQLPRSAVLGLGRCRLVQATRALVETTLGGSR